MLYKLIEDSTMIFTTTNFEYVIYQFLSIIKKYKSFISNNFINLHKQLKYNCYINIEYDNCSPYVLNYGKIIFENDELYVYRNNIKEKFNIYLFINNEQILNIYKQIIKQDKINRESIDVTKKLEKQDKINTTIQNNEIKENKEITDVNFTKKSEKYDKYIIDKNIFQKIYKKNNTAIPLLFNVQYNIFEYMYDNNLLDDNIKEYDIYKILEGIINNIYDGKDEPEIPEEYTEYCKNFITYLQDKNITTTEMINKMGKTDSIIESIFRDK